MAKDEVHGWVLLPVTVTGGFEEDAESYSFENPHAWFDSDTLGGGAWGFISTEEAPSMDDALAKMQRVW